MTKKELATLQRFALNAEQIQEITNDKLVSIIQDSLSALATSDPSLALDVIHQIADQKTMMEEAIQERNASNSAFIDSVVQKLPDYIDLEN